MLKLKKISPKNLTNEDVIAYDAKGVSKVGGLVTNDDGVILCQERNHALPNVIYYIKLSDIDKEARKQIKEMSK
jgi:hypothetical protein